MAPLPFEIFRYATAIYGCRSKYTGSDYLPVLRVAQVHGS